MDPVLRIRARNLGSRAAAAALALTAAVALVGRRRGMRALAIVPIDGTGAIAVSACEQADEEALASPSACDLHARFQTARDQHRLSIGDGRIRGRRRLAGVRSRDPESEALVAPEEHELPSASRGD